jgi:hypothetical protein
MSGPNTSQIAIIPTLNNNFPCEGPKDVPINFNFDPTTGQGTTQQVNLIQLMQANQISNVQSFFVDNSQNAAELTITVVGTNQRIILPPSSQAYLPVLMGQAQFNVSTTLATGLIVPIHCLNIPVVSCVWLVASSGGGGGTVTVDNFPATQNVNLSEVNGTAIALGQATEALSIPVVLPSNQTVATNMAQVGGGVIALGQTTESVSIPVTMASDQHGMIPGAAGTAQNASVTTSSGSVSISGGNNFLLTNVTGGNIYVRFGAGAQTAVIGDLCIPTGRQILVYLGLTIGTIAYIGDAAATLNIAQVNGVFH